MGQSLNVDAQIHGYKPRWCVQGTLIVLARKKEKENISVTGITGTQSATLLGSTCHVDVVQMLEKRGI